MRKILEAMLIPLARAVCRKYQPLIIAVTGTVGKTSTKNALGAALSRTRSVRAAEKNNNTEIGAAITVIGASSAGRSIIGWLNVFLKAFGLLTRRDCGYPGVLVLEFAAQRPGDIKRLCRLFPPTIGVLTSIGATHAEFLGGVEGVAEEKIALLAALPKSGAAVLNDDDQLAAAAASRTSARVIHYGVSAAAEVRALEPHPTIRRDERRGLYVEGMNFKLETGGKVIPVFLPGVLGLPAVYSALAALAVGIHLGENPLALAEGLRSVKSEKGRLRVIEGIKYSSIIDDTYNASTVSMIEALRALRSIPVDEGEERIAVLGEMREMGARSEEEHGKVGRAVWEAEVDRLVTVGERARDIGRAARAAGFPEERWTHFPSPAEAGRFVQNILEKGDIVLVKGSRGAHLEAVVKELMAEPLRAEELLELGEPTT